MGRGGKVNCKRNLKKRVRDKEKGSDESDEDYVVENEEDVTDDESEDLEVSLDGYASEESFDSFVEEDELEEEEEEEFTKPVRPKKKKRASSANGKVGRRTSWKRKRVSSEDDDDEDEEYIDDDNEDEGDDDDEEFTPDEEDEDCLDEQEELTVKRKRKNVKVVKGSKQGRGSGRHRKGRRKTRVSKKPLVKKERNNRRLKKRERCEYDNKDEDDFLADSPVEREKSKKNLGVRKRKYAVNSDSDFFSSGSSDCEYTISEEEREQVREASQLYGDLKTSLRSSSVGKRIEENGDSCLQTKPVGRKGKEKLKEVKPELGKQVCGVCLSEEDKRRLRGTLDSCSHYFCFTCIMEWSKVESRCPLCKQRFMTITKNGRSTVGVDLRNVVIQVPMRDQVYQPSEEEIRSYIDPYENVICKECHKGGDDGLMLLCDLCDSSAHTYCVGLGQQVPEGNWYCDDCRPVALGSSSSQAHDLLPDQRTTNYNFFNRPSPIVNLGEGLPSNLESSPRVAVTQGFGYLSSPRFPTGDVQLASPVSGAGAPTLSMRRHLHRHIQNLLSGRINLMGSRIDGISGSRMDGISAANLRSDLSNSRIDPGRETALQNLRTQEIGIAQQSFLGRIQDNDHPSSSVQNSDPFPPTPSQSRRQMVQDPASTTTDTFANLTLWPELMGINLMPGYERNHHYDYDSRLRIGSDGNLPPYTVREERQFYAVKEQVQSLVKSHLGRLSQDNDLGYDISKEIVRSSTHTVLAACGLDHKSNEVHVVAPPSTCTHIDRMAPGQTSVMKGLCSSCFDSFVRDVVKRIMDIKQPEPQQQPQSQWLSLGL